MLLVIESKLSTSGFSFHSHQTSTSRSHRLMQFLCPNRSKPRNHSILGSVKPTTCQEQMISSLKASPGPNLRLRLYLATLIKSRSISRRTTNSGIIWVETLPRQRHSLRKISPYQDITRKDTFWIQSLSQPLPHRDNRMQRHTQRQSLTLLVSRKSTVGLLSLLSQQTLLDQKNHMYTSLAMMLKDIELNNKLTVLSNLSRDLRWQQHYLLVLIRSIELPSHPQQPHHIQMRNTLLHMQVPIRRHLHTRHLATILHLRPSTLLLQLITLPPRRSILLRPLTQPLPHTRVQPRTQSLPLLPQHLEVF